MATDSLHCSVITPEARIFDGDVRSVVIPAHDGEVGIMKNRAPLLCKLGAGEMRIEELAAGSKKHWFVASGFAQVVDNKVIVLTQNAVPAEQIDGTKAANSLEAARAIKVTDEISARKKAQAEDAARAQLRIAKK